MAGLSSLPIRYCCHSLDISSYSFSRVTPLASYRRALWFPRWLLLILDRHGWLGGLGKDESRQHHDPSGSFRLPRWFSASRPTSEVGLRHWSPVLPVIGFNVARDVCRPWRTCPCPSPPRQINSRFNSTRLVCTPRHAVRTSSTVSLLLETTPMRALSVGS